MNALRAAVLLSCAALASAGFATSYGPPAPSPAYGAPAPAPVFRAAAPAYLAPAPVVRAFAPAPGVHAIPVVPFPGFGRAVVHHFADKVANHVGAVANVANAVADHVAKKVALVGDAVTNIARTVAEEKKALFDGFPSTVVFTPESLAVAAPPAGLAPPVTEYAPAPAPAPATHYGAPLF